MRWLFLLVLVLNLGYFVWQTNRDTGSDRSAIQPLAAVEPIVLLRELHTEAVTDVVSDSSGEGQAIKMPVESEQGGKTDAQITDTSRQVEETSPVVTAAAKGLPGESASSEKPVEVSKPDGTTSQASCFTLGPFRDLDTLRRLTREIKTYVTKTDFRGKEAKEKPLYWVYLKPEKTNAKAVATGKRLKAKKIKDFFVIRDGEKRHGISLGYFRNKDGAYGLAKRVGKLGFDVQVEVVVKTYTLYWLDYELATSAKIPDSIIDKYTKSKDKQKVGRLSRNCDSA